MTIRTVGSALVKLLGLYYGASAVLGICAALGHLVIPRAQGVLEPVQFALGASIGGWLGGIFVASFFVFRGDDVAKRLFPDAQLSWPDVTTRGLLAVGISLVGVSIGASGVVHLARDAATALWYAGAGRQELFTDAMRRLYPSPLDAFLSVIAGALLVWQSTRLSDLFYRRNADAPDA